MSNLPELVLYHAQCNDGFCAAWLWRRYKNAQAEFRPIQYGDEPPQDIHGRDVVLLDFSFKRDILLRMHENTHTLIVLDHHKTAQEELKGLDFCRFDMNKSGARVTLEYIRESVTGLSGADFPIWLVEYTEDRDLWRWLLPRSAEVSAALSSYPRTFEVWDHLYETGQDALVREGTAIQRYQNQVVEDKKKQAKWTELDGHRVPILNCTELVSETVGALAENNPFAIGFFIVSNDQIVYSLRSRGDGVDVADIARRNGGGGHRNAAGFTAPTLLPLFDQPKEAPADAAE